MDATMSTVHVRQLGVLAIMLLVVSLTLGACGSGGADEVNEGAGPGERIFATRCAACHARGTAMGYGPGLAGLFTSGGPTLPDGIDYDGKLPNGAAITDANVAAWIRTGGKGQIGQMPGIPLSEQEMADLLAYLKTLEP